MYTLVHIKQRIQCINWKGNNYVLYNNNMWNLWVFILNYQIFQPLYTNVISPPLHYTPINVIPPHLHYILINVIPPPQHYTINVIPPPLHYTTMWSPSPALYNNQCDSPLPCIIQQSMWFPPSPALYNNQCDSPSPALYTNVIPPSPALYNNQCDSLSLALYNNQCNSPSHAHPGGSDRGTFYSHIPTLVLNPLCQTLHTFLSF